MPNNQFSDIFLDRLIALKKQGKKSQEAIADACGVAQSTVSSWINGETFPNAIEIAQMADLFGCHPGDFFGTMEMTDRLGSDASPEVIEILIKMRKDLDEAMHRLVRSMPVGYRDPAPNLPKDRTMEVLADAAKRIEEKSSRGNRKP